MKLTLVMNYAQDLVIDKATGKRFYAEGGPAHYLGDFLKKKGYKFKLLHGKKARCENIIEAGHWIGKVVRSGKIKLTKPVTSDMFIVSPMLDEVPVSLYSKMKGLVCLDVQGYIRVKNVVGKKKVWTGAKKIQGKVNLLKVSDFEVDYIPQKVINFFKKDKESMYLFTKGPNGSEVYHKGKKSSFIGSKKPFKNTIGAGDAFFALFCTKYFETKDIKTAGRYATVKVEEFLRSKNQ